MKRLADDVEQLPGFPPNVVNVYLAGGVMFDAGTRNRAGGYLRALKGRKVDTHALTHAHPDHQGATRAVVDALGVPLCVGAVESDAIERGDLALCMPDSLMARFARAAFAGPACPVARRLREGDEVGGFTVLDAPGHSPGHVAYWRESDRTLVIGDVLNGMNLITGMPGLHQPPTFFTVDPELNRASARKLAALAPHLVLFGHGPPWRAEGARAGFAEEVDRLLA